MTKTKATRKPSTGGGVKRRGFASLSPERRREISAAGGRAVPAEKRSFKNPELAAKAGAIGGAKMPAERRSFSINRELASEAGKKGGAVSSDAKLVGAAKGGQANARRIREEKAKKSAESIT